MPPLPIERYAQKIHTMGGWNSDSKSHVASMTEGDFFGSEQSCTIEEAMIVRIEHLDSDGHITILKDNISLQKGEIVDSSVMNVQKLQHFLQGQIADAKEQDVLFSIHLKATMMKISDPIVFGHTIRVFFADVFEKYGDILNQIGFDPNKGLQDLEQKLNPWMMDFVMKIQREMQDFVKRPQLAMVDSEHGITNLHVPSDVIIDASMPTAIRNTLVKCGDLMESKKIPSLSFLIAVILDLS